MSMPSYWFDPMVNTGGSGLNNAYASQAQTNAYLANQQNQLAQWNSYNPWANTPGGFGAQTAYYQQQAANSYGNINSATLSPGSVGASQPPPTPQPGNVFDYGTSAFNPYGGMGGGQIFDPGQYYKNNPDVWSAGADAWKHYNVAGKNEGRQGTWADAFNSSNYLANNPDVYAAGVDPTAHWFQFGAKEGRTGGGGENPFDTKNYLANNPDVFQAGADPTQHWLQFGQKEGRQGGWGENPFNAQEYLLENRDVAAAGADPYQHWLNFGSKEGRGGTYGETEASDWNNYFNQATQGGGGANTGRDALAAEYLLANQDVFDAARASGQDPTQFGLDHLMSFGQNEGRGFFDPNAYLQQNQDVAAAGVDPTAHWYQFGSKEGRAAPTTEFNYADYLAKNPDVLGSGMDPMAHWLQFGANEKRQGALGANANTLVAERNAFAESVRNNPELANRLAVKLYQEDQNSGEGRTALMEAMLNRLNATGQNPLNPDYYPKDKGAYNSQIENKVLSDNALLNQIYQEMERAFGGSNLSNYATDWASADVADNAAKYSTETWVAPSGERFFRKDISNPWAGAGTAARNQKWYGQFAK